MTRECHTVTVIDRTFSGDRNYTVPFCLTLDEAIQRVQRTEHIPNNAILIAFWVESATQ